MRLIIPALEWNITRIKGSTGKELIEVSETLELIRFLEEVVIVKFVPAVGCCNGGGAGGGADSRQLPA